MRRALYVTCALFSFVLSRCAPERSCCLIATPEINITGEKTVVERQIVGDYRELEEDAWAVSSVQTNVARFRGSPLPMGGDEVLYTAMKIREFNAEKVRRYKNDGAVGEAMDGYLAYRTDRRYEENIGLKEDLLRLVRDENDARRTLFERSLYLALKQKPDDRQIADVGLRFAEEQRALAARNHWIQEKSGRWVRKR